MDKAVRPVTILHDDPWHPLRLFNIYRVVAVGILLLAFQLDTSSSPFWLGQTDKMIFSATLGAYLIVVIIWNLTCHFRWPDYSVQIILQTLTDTLFVLLLIYSSGGVGSGLGILLVISAAGAGLLHPGLFATGLAAVMSIGLLGTEFYLNDTKPESASIPNAGMIALLILSSAWLASRLVVRASRQKDLARRRGLDLANMSQLNNSILNQLQNGILVIDESMNIRQMNSTAWDMLGQPPAWRTLPLDKIAPELCNYYRYWFDRVSPQIVSYDIRHLNTTELRTRFTQLGMRSNAATLIYLEDPQEQYERLQGEKLASLGHLTASIAHEIRNPLGAISHSAQLMWESPNLDRADQRLLQIIESNCKRMNVTIESVLNLSRKKNPQREPIQLKVWLQDFITEFRLQNKLQDKQISLFIEPSDVKVEFDPTHLHQILWNLCRNAVKYARKDTKNLRIDLQGGQLGNIRNIILNVIDNGSGVPEDQQQRLFEPFFTTSASGTGLGLFMARELCLSNGGTLEYMSLPTGGSCFRIVFSRQKSH